MKNDTRRPKKTVSKPLKRKVGKAAILKGSSNGSIVVSVAYNNAKGSLSKNRNHDIQLTGGGIVIPSKNGEIPIHNVAFNDKIKLIEQGFAKQDILHLKNKYHINYPTLAKILDITERTIQSKPNEFRFKGAVAEKVLALSGLYSYGLEVFEDEQKFINWLNNENSILSNREPIDLLYTMIGIEEVKREIGRIDYGVY